MKAVLSIPHHWQHGMSRATLCHPEFPWNLGRDILRALRSNVLVYDGLPKDLRVEIEWLPDNANPKLAEPTLFVEVSGTGTRIPKESANNAGHRFAVAMKETLIATLIPDCQVIHQIVSRYQAPIGG